jgi:hypothetical protein
MYDSKSTHILGFTHLAPSKPVVFAFLAHFLPKEAGYVFFETSMGTIGKQEKTHTVYWQVGQSSVSKDQVGSQGGESTLPRINMVPYHLNQALPINLGKFSVSNQEP